MGVPLDFIPEDGWPYPDEGDGDGTEAPDPVDLRFDPDDDLVALHALPPRALASLSPDERAVLVARFGLDGSDPMTFEAMRTTLGMSRRRVRYVLSGGIAKLREALGDGEPG
ncbi:MAG: sigma factor-like helix-turn-helix DNA-binding protein [Acidimicrobiia bacterium]